MNQRVLVIAFCLLISFLTLFLSSCVCLRDYTGAKEGAFGLEITQQMGEGAEQKDYYVTGNNEVVVQGYNKKEIVASLGYPDKVDINLEGDEVWRYEDEQIEILIYEGKVKSWRKF
ncbi:MAG: hypothetical protein K9L77_04360 [Candidatus Omnitrophica bacterium]|nr:hypothetical protein [Candidatus Omnitrophota bacterium]MCF7893378.1 hypothetical protein [Candidatus Omnitrophota bacterium]